MVVRIDPFESIGSNRCQVYVRGDVARAFLELIRFFLRVLLGRLLSFSHVYLVDSRRWIRRLSSFESMEQELVRIDQDMILGIDSKLSQYGGFEGNGIEGIFLRLDRIDIFYVSIKAGLRSIDTKASQLMDLKMVVGWSRSALIAWIRSR